VHVGPDGPQSTHQLAESLSTQREALRRVPWRRGAEEYGMSFAGARHDGDWKNWILNISVTQMSCCCPCAGVVEGIEVSKVCALGFVKKDWRTNQQHIDATAKRSGIDTAFSKERRSVVGWQRVRAVGKSGGDSLKTGRCGGGRGRYFWSS